MSAPDTAFGLRLPEAPETERFMIGALLRQDGLDLVSPLIQPEDFYNPKYRRIYRGMLKLQAVGSPVELASVADLLAHDPDFEGGRIADLLEADADGIPTPAPFVGWAQRIRDCSLKRQIITTAYAQAQAAANTNDPADETLGNAISAFSKLQGMAPTGELDLFTVRQYIEHVGVTQYFAPPLLDSLDTHIPALNNLLPSLTGGEVIVIGARTSVGKSTLAQQIAAHVAHRHHVLYHTLEMKGQTHVDRTITQIGGPTADRMRRRDRAPLTKEEIQRGTEVECEFSERTGDRLVFSTNRRLSTVPAITRLVRSQKAKRNLRLVVVDHLGLVKPTGEVRGQYEGVSQVARDFHLMAGCENVVLILLVQLNRSSENEKRAPELSDLRDSGVIEEEADCIILIHRKDENAALRDEPEGELIVKKNRLGPTGRVKFVFVRNALRFGEKVEEPYYERRKKTVQANIGDD